LIQRILMLNRVIGGPATVLGSSWIMLAHLRFSIQEAPSAQRQQARRAGYRDTGASTHRKRAAGDLPSRQTLIGRMLRQIRSGNRPRVVLSQR
jgi:hypothetical protein